MAINTIIVIATIPFVPLKSLIIHHIHKHISFHWYTTTVHHSEGWSVILYWGFLHL